MRRPLATTLMMSAPMIVPSIGAAAAAQRRAADDDGGDGVELVALADRRLRRVDARGDEEAGDAADAAGERVDGDLPAIDVDARQPQRLLVAAQREDVAAEHGAAEDEGRGMATRNRISTPLGIGSAGMTVADQRAGRDLEKPGVSLK